MKYSTRYYKFFFNKNIKKLYINIYIYIYIYIYIKTKIIKMNKNYKSKS